jgi:hypothetical protein
MAFQNSVNSLRIGSNLEESSYLKEFLSKVLSLRMSWAG